MVKNVGLLFAISATRNGDVEKLKEYVSNNGDIEATDTSKNPLLMIAAKKHHLSTMRYLCDLGANVNGTNKYGNTALMALRRESENKNIKEDNAHLKESIKLLLDHGADIHYKNKLGDSALTYAIEGGDLEKVKELLKHGANPNDTGRHDRHASFIALGRDHYLCYQMVYALIDHGANHLARNQTDQTLSHAAVDKNKAKSFIEFLIKKGVPIDAVDREGRTALQLCAATNRGEYAEYLISEGSNISHQDHDGKTSMIIASNSRCKEMVELLAKYQASPLIRDSQNKTALDYAKFQKDRHLVEFLSAYEQQWQLDSVINTCSDNHQAISF